MKYACKKICFIFWLKSLLLKVETEAKILFKKNGLRFNVFIKFIIWTSIEKGIMKCIAVFFSSNFIEVDIFLEGEKTIKIHL